MSFLYVTADVIGRPNHGGGTVTWNESRALASLGPHEVWDRSQLENTNAVSGEPWHWDIRAFHEARWRWGVGTKQDKDLGCPKLAHFYAGTFSQSVDALKFSGCKVSYTAAAHDIELSRREHEGLGIPFHYPHLTDPALWRRYVAGYLDADLVVCPSSHSKRVMQSFGCRRVEVVPHGVALPAAVRNLPEQFTVGYLGSFGPDKGLRYLLAAWKKLDYRDDSVLMLGGRDSTSDFALNLIRAFGGGNILVRGWVDRAEDFYADCSVYCQPSITEGFGLEVLEAASCGRPVVCSDGAGAVDLVRTPYDPCGWEFPAGNVDALIEAIKEAKDWFISCNDGSCRNCFREGERKIQCSWIRACLREAEERTWDKIRSRYCELWKGLLDGNTS